MSIHFVQTIAFLGAVSLSGILVYLAICRFSKDRKEVILNFSQLGLMFILGGGAYTFFEMGLSILGVKSSLWHFGLLTVLVAAANGVLYLGGQRPEIKVGIFLRGRQAGMERLVIAIVVIALCGNLLLAMALPRFDIDLVAHILMKAKLFTTDTYKSSVFLHDAVFANVQSRYPPFVGMVYNLLFLFGGHTVSCYQIVNYFIFLMLALSVYTFLKARLPLWQARAWLLVFISTASYISTQFILDSTDVLFSLSLLLAVFSLLEFSQTGSRFSLLMLAVLAGMSTLIKNEGLFFSLVVLALVVWQGRAAVWRNLAPFLIIAAPWTCYRFTLPNPLTGPDQILATANIFGSLRFLPQALLTAGNILLEKWNAVFVLWLATAALLLKSRYRKECIVFSVVSGALLLAYLVMTWLYIGRIPSYANTFFRVLGHIYPMAFICVALAVERLLRE